MIKGELYKKLENGWVSCLLCSHYCKIGPDKVGICKVRKNIDGEIETERELSLSKGVKYNFNTDPGKDTVYHEKFNSLLEDREGITIDKAQAIDLKMLSAELEIAEGEEFAFSLFPDANQKELSALDLDFSACL